MSKERKSFLLHFDSLGILDQLTPEQCGKLFIACRDFNLGKELCLDETLSLVFFPFKAQFLRDQEKYQIVVDRNKNNGSKGGRPKNPVKADKPSGLIDNPTDPKKADSDSDSDNDSDSGSDSLVEVLPQRSKYKFSDDDVKCAEWIFQQVRNVAPSSKQPNIENWANTIRLMRESDELTYQDISDVFSWANKDPFWSVNILSVAKLRKQFPQLQAKMKGVNNGQSKNTGKKLSAYERVKQRNDAQYRQPDERELGMGTNGGHLGRAVDEGEGGTTIDHVDNEPFVDY